MTKAIGIDLGGTNFRIALFDHIDSASTPSEVEVLCELEEMVGEDRTPSSVVRRIADSVTKLVEQASERADVVGIGFAGMLSGCEGFVVNSPHFGWRDVAFGQMLREAIDCDVVIENDVNVAVVAEAALGSAVGIDNVLAVYAGTGVGGGVIAGGRLVTGSTGCAGEIGHTKVDWSERARPCHCGKRGCVEAYVGGRNLRERILMELMGGATSAAIARAGGAIADVQISDIDAAAGDGDDYALELYDEIAPLLGVALANAITLLNPKTLLLGGGVLSRAPVLREHVLTAMQVAANPPALAGLSIAEPSLGERAGLFGAAVYAIQRLED